MDKKMGKLLQIKPYYQKALGGEPQILSDATQSGFKLLIDIWKQKTISINWQDQ